MASPRSAITLDVTRTFIVVWITSAVASLTEARKDVGFTSVEHINTVPIKTVIDVELIDHRSRPNRIRRNGSIIKPRTQAGRNGGRNRQRNETTKTIPGFGIKQSASVCQPVLWRGPVGRATVPNLLREVWQGSWLLPELQVSSQTLALPLTFRLPTL